MANFNPFSRLFVVLRLRCVNGAVFETIERLLAPHTPDLTHGCGILWQAIAVDFHTSMRGWSGGAKVLGKLSVPGRPTSLDDSRARAYCACSRCGWGLFGQFSLISLFFLPLLGRGPQGEGPI